MNDWGEDFVTSLGFLLAADLVIRAEALCEEAHRCERYNAPWARNRRRRAAHLVEKAQALCRDRPLPWGVRIEDYGVDS